jgi:hypothetical protein
MTPAGAATTSPPPRFPANPSHGRRQIAAVSSSASSRRACPPHRRVVHIIYDKGIEPSSRESTSRPSSSPPPAELLHGHCRRSKPRLPSPSTPSNQGKFLMSKRPSFASL